jgi:hypothetical protein
MRLIAAIFFAVTILSGIGCHSTRTTSAELIARHPEWPLTVDDAVTRILAGMSAEEKEHIRNTKKDDLITLSPRMGHGHPQRVWSPAWQLLTDGRLSRRPPRKGFDGDYRSGLREIADAMTTTSQALENEEQERRFALATARERYCLVAAIGAPCERRR